MLVSLLRFNEVHQRLLEPIDPAKRLTFFIRPFPIPMTPHPLPASPP